MSNRPFLFCFGLGYSASELARRLLDKGWQVAGTSQRPITPPPEDGIERFPFRRDSPWPTEGLAAVAAATHLLVSVPPDSNGDPVLDACRGLLTEAGRLYWIGYLSSTSVYGDTGGRTVDEDSPLRPTSPRGRWRVAAERDWLELGREQSIAVQIFRLAGIYGPGRSAFDRLRAGKAQRIYRPGHRFSRIHVADIATVLEASIQRPRAGAIYNVADDEPAEPEQVIAFAAKLLGQEPPALVGFEQAAKEMSPMAQSFWRDNRVVLNRRIKYELGVQLAYANFREGLKAILASGTSGT